MKKEEVEGREEDRDEEEIEVEGQNEREGEEPYCTMGTGNKAGMLPLAMIIWY